MNSARLDFVVRHDGRLNLLCSLLDSGPLSTPQIAARIGESEQAVRYWVRLLLSFDLIEERPGGDDGEPLYAAALDGQPGWIRKAVAEHRPRNL